MGRGESTVGRHGTEVTEISSVSTEDTDCVGSCVLSCRRFSLILVILSSRVVKLYGRPVSENSYFDKK